MKAFEATLVLLLALVFALAGVAKLRGRAAFAAVLRKLTPRVHGLLTVVIPALEITLALLLVSGWMSRWIAVAVVVVLGAFSLALLRMRRLHMGCGCFGEQADGDSIALGLVRNGLLIVAAGWLVVYPPSVPPWRFEVSDRVGMLTVILGLVCAWRLCGGLVRSILATRSLMGMTSV
jgi:uncharacterized membrane protein YphA (DoxX/SURF4 family)